MALMCDTSQFMCDTSQLMDVPCDEAFLDMLMCEETFLDLPEEEQPVAWTLSPLVRCQTILEQYTSLGLESLRPTFNRCIGPSGWFLDTLWTLLDGSHPVMVVTVCYLLRLGQRYSIVGLNQPLLMTLALVAGKYWEDDCYENRAFAQAFRLQVRLISSLEREVLDLLDYRLDVTRVEYDATLKFLKT